MIQAKFSLAESHVQFLKHYNRYGFKDPSAFVREALTWFQREFVRETLQGSTDLYAEVYEEDEEIQELTETTIKGWPE